MITRQTSIPIFIFKRQLPDVTVSSLVTVLLHFIVAFHHFFSFFHFTYCKLTSVNKEKHFKWIINSMLHRNWTTSVPQGKYLLPSVTWIVSVVHYKGQQVYRTWYDNLSGKKIFSSNKLSLLRQRTGKQLSLCFIPFSSAVPCHSTVLSL
jgi:hypothetical protein